MSDERALLRAVIADPDDDLPRLVLADWWDEHGQPERAEFCRAQCELAGYDFGRNEPAGETAAEVDRKWLERDARIDALRRRERELLSALRETPDGFSSSNRARWSEPVCAAAGGKLADYPEFIRGFPCVVRLAWADWLAHHAALLDAAPLRRVNRPKKCPDCDGTVPAWLPQACSACRGTGTVDDWRGEGVVRLTTWMFNAAVLECVDLTEGHFRAAVRRAFSRGATSYSREDHVREQIEDQYPGVRFEWLSEPRGADGLTAREVAGRINARAAEIAEAESADDEALTGGRP